MDGPPSIPALMVPALVELVKRVNITVNKTSPDGAWEAITVDPWYKSAKYALGWVYFACILLALAGIVHAYHLFQDMIRSALFYRENQLSAEEQRGRQVEAVLASVSPASGGASPEKVRMGGLSAPLHHQDEPVFADPLDEALYRQQQHAEHERREAEQQLAYVPPPDDVDTVVGRMTGINVLIAIFRAVFYRPIPEYRLSKKMRPIASPSLAVIGLAVAATAFTLCYCFVPQPLFWQDIQFGSPPLAIRAGMLSVSLVPWVVALAMRANFISMITGIGHERLNVLHRWLAYVCLIMAIVHMVPFYIDRIDSTAESRQTFAALIDRNGGMYVYGTGIAALVPLILLCVHSLPVLRRIAYEVFVVIHTPLSIIFVGFMFWHCNNYLTSWNYLIATCVIWGCSLLYRLTFVNWARIWAWSWIVGDESAITILPENAVKITVPTQMKWRPGQYVYIRMPAISLVGNHPFTIASLCSDDFPSDYGDGFHDMQLVFRPFGGFTRQVLDTGAANGPWQTYRAYIDGPYGGMTRRIESFDTVVLLAGGSGITALVSQLLYLIKRMRDGKAATKKVLVVWSVRRPDTFGWFSEELRICRQFAPPNTVSCRMFITARPDGKSEKPAATTRPFSLDPSVVTNPNNQGTRPTSTINKTVDGYIATMAEKRISTISGREKRLSGLAGPSDLQARPQHQQPGEEELVAEQEDGVGPLPTAWAERRRSAMIDPLAMHQVQFDEAGDRPSRTLSLDVSAAVSAGTTALESSTPATAGVDGSVPSFHLPVPNQYSGPTSDSSRPTLPKLLTQPPEPAHLPGSTPTDFQKSFMRYAFLSPATTTLPRTDLRQKSGGKKGGKRSSSAGPSTTAGGEGGSGTPLSPVADAVSPASSTATATPMSGVRPHLNGLSFWRKKHDLEGRPADPVHRDHPETGVEAPEVDGDNNTNIGGFSFGGIGSDKSPLTAGVSQTGMSPIDPNNPGGVFGATSLAGLNAGLKDSAWSVELGRPDLPRLLRTSAPYWGRRTCVFVCGPARMRTGVAKEVAVLQDMVIRARVPAGNGLDREVRLKERKAEVFLHTENYNL